MNVPSMGFWIGFIQMFFCIPGSFLITHNKENQDKNQNVQYEDQDDKKLVSTQELEQNKQQLYTQYKSIDYQLKLYEQSDRLDKNSNLKIKSSSNQQLQIDQNSTTCISTNPQSLLSIKEFGFSKSKLNNSFQHIQDDNKNNFDESLAYIEDKDSHKQEIQNLQITLVQAAKSNVFIIIYFSTMFLSFFSMFLSINFKTYGLTKINDDHFLTYLVTLCSLFSSLSNIMWGYLVDKYNFRSVYMGLIVAILFSGFIFPYVSDNKFGFFIVYQVLSSCERGLSTIIGPGLVQIFGIRLGAELFPIKTSSFFLALIILPIVQLLLLKQFDYDQSIHLLLIGVVIAFLMSYQLQSKYNYQ